MHPVFVLALLNCASALSECQASECEGDQSVSLLAIGRRSLRETAQARESLAKANAAVMALLEKTAAEGYDLTPDQQSAINAISDLIQEILDHATQSHTTDEAELTTAVGAVNNCGTTATASLNGAVANFRTTMEDRRGVHTGCRTNEAALNVEVGSTCAAYNNHRTVLANQAPPCAASKLTYAFTSTNDAAERAEMEACVVLVHAWSTAFVALYEPCQEAMDAHAPVKAVCDGNQGSFEAGYCSWTMKLDDTCDAQDACRDAAVPNLAASVTSIQAAEAARKADWTSGKRIQCYLQVFSTDKDQRAAKLTSCRNEDISTAALDVTYPVADDAVTCVKEASFPCAQSFLNAEYIGTTWYSQAPTTACNPCST